MKKQVLAVICLLILLVLSGCSKFKSPTDTVPVEAKPEMETVKATAVQSYTVDTGSLVAYQNFGGDVYPVYSMDILPETTGKVVKLLVSEGDTVQKDQVIGEIDQSKPGLNYNTSAVKAPMDGTILSLNAQLGGMASPSMSFGKVISTDKLEIRFSVVERYLSLVNLGQKALITFDAYPDLTFPASITRLSPILDKASRTRTIYCTLDQPDSRIIAGMYAKVKVITEEKSDCLVVPDATVLTNTKESYVFVIDDTTARKVVVTTGIESEGMLEITSGLKKGAKIVAKGQNLLSDGTQVVIASSLGGSN
ncbi:efflux RND transporter periplasmic adaptor subunit [uncultured Sphaerochaeta sp.]|uniref:efflux RND transporter periplasmic adaptor subunit n=1 Tax=uncultured Sphaerochaeta sp. TaxID=886478 RepID=UPI002A0A7347|nr:efflux RND transporter periplasmic adaptor subunit [uncultured Sphaerochaeta sp.]